MFRRIALVLSLTAVALMPAGATEIGEKIAADDLAFKDIWYLPRTLSEFQGESATVLVFINSTCPIAQRYMPVVDAMAVEYAEKGVNFIGVNVSPDESIMDASQHAIAYELDFPVVKDFDGSVAKAVGATHTPEAAIIDSGGALRYRGRIDDQYRLSGVSPKAANHFLKDAIDAVLSDGEIAKATTPVDGCDITFEESEIDSSGLTFAKDVAPIVHAKCTECHRDGTAAPFALETYRDVASRADMIAEVVSEQRMPPWYAHPDHGEFMNDRSLSADQRDIIVRWARGDKERGNPADMPAVPEFPDPEWVIGEPDLVITAKDAFEIPAQGYVDYQYIVLPHVFPHDTWVQGIEIKPSNPKVVHHANLVYLEDGSKYNEKSSFLTGKVPGGSAAILSPRQAMFIPEGSVLMLQVHYVTTGKPESDQIGVGIRYAEGRIDKHVRYQRIEDKDFAIPPGAVMHRSFAAETLADNVDMIALFSHMHLRGRDMTFVAKYPDGKEETLLVVPNYSFDWQLSYLYEPDTKHFPKGTTIEVTAHFDNSEFNPFNPGPEKTVEYGPQTYHEMMIGYMYFTLRDEELNLMVDGDTGKAIEPVASLSK